MTQGFFPILLILPPGLGPAVLASGLIARLRHEIPNARLTLAACPAAAPLFADTPGLEEVFVLDGPGVGPWLRLWGRARRRRWGLVVDLRGSALHRFLRTRRRAVARPSRQPMHKVLEAARLLKLEDEPPAPHIFIAPETEAKALALTSGAGPILALAPGAAWVGKAWPEERFAQLAMRLLGPGGPLAGGRLMVVGEPGDLEAAQALRRVTPKSHFIDLAGKADLPTIQACLARARLFIGNEGGLLQMAAAAGAPAMGLFGPTDEGLWAPWGAHARTVRGARTLDQIRQTDPALNQSLCHMMDLSVDTVARAAYDLLQDTETSHGGNL